MGEAAGPHFDTVSCYRSHYLVGCRRGYAAAFVRRDFKWSNGVVNLQQRGKVADGNGHQLLDAQLPEATRRRFTGRDIFHAAEHVPPRSGGR